MSPISTPRLAALATGALLLATGPAGAEGRSGETVYQATCIVCHGNGLLGAPRLGDHKRWKKLVREGLDELVPAALKGVRAMPPKGNNPTLSDLEVARAVVFMANAGGGNFREPGDDDAMRWRALANTPRKER